MSNFVVRNLHQLRKRHYLLLANQAGHWFNASPNVVEDHKRAYGTDFCLILYRSGPSDDAYVMPFRLINSLFT